MSVRWGLTGTADLPEDVEEIEIVRCDRVDGEETCTSPFTCTVAALTLTRAAGPVPGCRPAEGTEMYMERPVLLRSGLPTGVPIRFVLRGKSGGVTTHVGQAGPFVLGEGERRFVETRMYPVGQTVPLPDARVRRFLHTATPLPDGRILVAGGFDRAARLDECPAALEVPADARCWRLSATAEALAFDVATGQVTPIRGAMLAARAGHTATALPDGRVLLAGGAPEAVLAMVPQGEATVGYRFTIAPLREDGAPGALASFEIFDAFLGAALQAPARTGDPGRGGFFGTNGAAEAGPLSQPRFFHAATAIPTRPGRVLLAGGLGRGTSAATFELFAADKPGGFGVLRGMDDGLSVPRPLPGAAGVGEQVVVFGSGAAESDAELADVWGRTMESDPTGSARPATDVGFLAGEEGRPDLALQRPNVVQLDERHVVVVGWYGPRCTEDEATPIYPSDAPEDATLRLCDSPMAPATRAVTLSAMTGAAAPTPLRPHSFGATAELRDFDGTPESRRVAITGGISNGSWGATATVDVLTGEIDESGAAVVAPPAGLSLARPRLFHTSTGVPGFGLVTLGGMTFDLGVESIGFEEEPEVAFLAP